MEMKNKTCLFCVKQRQILVENPKTATALENVYGINLSNGIGPICIECHFNILRVEEFKRTIEAAADFDVDSCFVCKSEITVEEPGVDRVVDYLVKQCTTIDFGNTDTIKACVICMHMLETHIKYEKLAKNYSTAKRFCKQYSTLKECNVALSKIDLNALGEFCERFNNVGNESPHQKRGRKRGRSSIGGEDLPTKKYKAEDDASRTSKKEDVPTKTSKQEDETVLPVMLTKLTPAGGKKSPINVLKGKSSKQSEKIFIKLPLFSKQKKKLSPKKKFSLPNSPIRSIPASPSVDDLNRIFNVEFRPLTVQIEHVDLSSYLNKTIAHDAASRQLRKSRKEEFIGLDEEDLVELQNTSISSSISKRKSILITERTESPNSAKKKVKFSDSPSIKYVDKLDFSDGDDNEETCTNDAVDNHRKKTSKQSNGTSPATPENGKQRGRGRPRRTLEAGNEIIKQDVDKDMTAKMSAKDTDVCEKVPIHSSEEVEDKSEPVEVLKSDEDDSKGSEDCSSKEFVDTSIAAKEADETTSEGYDHDEKDTKEVEQASVDSTIETIEDKDADEIKSNSIPQENGEPEVQKTEPIVQPQAIIEELPSSDVTSAAPMDAEEVDDAEPMKVDQNEDPPTDAEMKPVDSPEDVEMTESKSPLADDVEMKEMDNITAEIVPDPNTEAFEKTIIENANNDSVSSVQEKTTEINPTPQSTAEFETSDKEEEEMEQFKLSLSTILGEGISDSDQDTSQQSQINKSSPSTDLQPNKSEISVESNSTEKDEHQCEPPHSGEAESTPLANSDQKVSDVESPGDKKPSYSSLDDVDEISDDEGILDELNEPTDERRRSPELPPLGEDSL